MKLLVLKTDKNKSQLPIVINALGNEVDFHVLTSDKVFFDSLIISEANKKFSRSLQEPVSFADYLFFTIFSPFLVLFNLFRIVTLKIKKYDGLILTSIQDYLLITPVAKIFGLKIYWYRSSYFEDKFKANIYSLFLRAYSGMVKVISTSLALSKYLINEIKLKEKNIITINRGVDLEHLKVQSDIYEDMVQKEYQIQNKALFVIGFIGNLIKENGIEYLIKAVEHFKELIPDFQILIIGDGELKKELIWLTKMSGLTSHVRFVGRQEMIQRWYKYFNVLVVPRIEKTEFCNVVAESMANGIPVVASDLDGIQEIIGDDGGILVPPKDAHALAEAIYLIFNDKDLSERFSKLGSKRIKENFSLDAMVENYKNIFRS